MGHITAEYIPTFEEFAEAFRILQRRRWLLSEKPGRSPWIGFAVMAGLFVLVIAAMFTAIYWTGHTVTAPNGRLLVESNSPIISFLSEFAGWVMGIAFFWLLCTRTHLGRRMAWRITVLYLLFGAASSLVSALNNSDTSANSSSSDGGNWTLSLLPWIILICGMLLIALQVFRQVIRFAWEGQPYLHESQRIEASGESLAIRSKVLQIEYSWPIFRFYRETDRLFILFPSALSFQMIPKRAFAAPADLEAFRELLSLKVPAEKPQRRGFEVKVLPLAAAK